MKNLISILFIISLSLLSSCNKDECSDIKCLNNGTCINGNCECPSGYSGIYCGNQIAPKKIKIIKIKITKFPTTDNGAGWDLTSGSDIYIALAYNKSLSTTILMLPQSTIMIFTQILIYQMIILFYL
jgi:hypothetical protein